MRKKHRSTESDEPLSEGRVEYLEAARQRVRNRRIRRTAVLLVLLTAVVLFATGIAGSSVAALKDLTDTARIALLPGSGWPQQTGVAELEQMAPLTGSFVELGDEGCVVWSRTGKKLNSIQSGYARPALAAGKTRFVLYNRSGNELRVESRTQNLYPPADGLFPRQPEAGGGSRHRQRGTGDDQPLPHQSGIGRSRQSGESGRCAPVAGVDLRFHDPGCLRYQGRALQCGRRRACGL